MGKKIWSLLLTIIIVLGCFTIITPLPATADTNHPPVADAGQPYEISIGDTLHLVGSGSDPDFGDSIVNYEWDLNGDGVYDASGENILIGWEQLANILVPQQQYYPADPMTRFPKISLTLRVTDNNGAMAMSTTTLTIYDTNVFALITWVPQPYVPVIMPDGTATVHLDGSASFSMDPRYPIQDWAWQVIGTTDWVHGEIVDMPVDLNPLPGSFPYGVITRQINLVVTSLHSDTASATFTVTFDQLPSQPPEIKFNVDRQGVFIEQGEGFSVSAAGTIDPDGDWIRSLGWDINIDGVDDILWDRSDTNGDGLVNGDDASPSYALQITWAQMAAYPGLQGLGQHTIRLTVTDSTGVWASATVPLNIVEKALFAEAIVSPVVGDAGTPIFFDGSYSWHLFPGQSITNWQWDYNSDGSFDAAGQIVHYYFDSPGIKTVTLKVMDAVGRWNTDTVQVVIWPENLPPIANTGGPYMTTPGTGLTLDGSLSLDPNQPYDYIVDYLWDIDDDGVFTDATGVNPVISDAQIIAIGGTQVGLVLPVSLKVTDSYGLTSIAAQTTIMVVSDMSLTASFSASTNLVSAGETVAFSACSSYTAPGYTITSYNWDFGDGTTDTGMTISHLYTVLGNFTVTLTVTDNYIPPRTATATDNIRCEARNYPHANPGGPYVIIVGDTLFLDGSQSYDPDGPYGDDISSWEWDVNNDDVCDFVSETPLITWAELSARLQTPQDYPADPVTGLPKVTVTLKVTDGTMRTNEASTLLTIYAAPPPNQPPVAEAGPHQTADQTSFEGALVILDGSCSTDDGQLSSLTYTWTWSGGSASGVNPLVSLLPGSTTITLTVYDGEFSDSDTVFIGVIDMTPPNITAPATVNLEQTSPAGTEASLLPLPVVSDAADPNPEVANNAPPVLPPGVTSVIWTAMDAMGNMAQITQAVTVWDTTPPAISAASVVTVEQTSPAGTSSSSLSLPTVSDAADPNPVVTSDAPAILPPGVTIVTWTVTDATGNTATATQSVTVQDTTPPTITPPADITVEQNIPGGAAIESLGTTTVTDAADPDPVVTNDAPAVFPLGVTTVVWTAMDSSGNSAEATQAVTVTPAQYTLDITITGNGIVNRNNDGPYYDGDIVQLTAVPDSGWSFSRWGNDLSGNYNPAAITMDGDKTVTAAFAINIYNITSTAEAGGSIDPSGDIIVSYGADQSFNIIPDTGYNIFDVVVDGVSQGALNHYAFSGVTADHTIAASFVAVSSPVEVISPNGGENWEIYSVQTISWSSTSVSGPVRIEISQDGGITWTTIIPFTPNDGSQRWIVLGAASTEARIKISSIYNPALFDISDANFTIVKPLITITSPNGGESWKIGSTHTIAWNSTSVLLVKIELSRDGGLTWTTIVPVTTSNGSKTWRVAGPVTTQARIRVVSLINYASDISDADSSIVRK